MLAWHRYLRASSNVATEELLIHQKVRLPIKAAHQLPCLQAPED